MAAVVLGLHLVLEPGSAGGGWVYSDHLPWSFPSLFLQEIMFSEVPNPGDVVFVWQRRWLETFRRDGFSPVADFDKPKGSGCPGVSQAALYDLFLLLCFSHLHWFYSIPLELQQ